MANRIVSGILAILGAAVIGAACWVPYLVDKYTTYRIFGTGRHSAEWFFALEPIGVMVAAVVFGILMLARPVRIAAGVFLATGFQTLLFFIGFIGYYSQVSWATGRVHAGPWIGLVGAALLVGAGAFALAVRPREAVRPANTAALADGWYLDPQDSDQLRYWAGSRWTEHTQSRVEATAPFVGEPR